MTSLSKDLARSAYHRVRRTVGTYNGSNHNLSAEVRIKTRRFGTYYGGWVIAPTILPKSRPLMYSFGLGEDISFDLAMIREYGASVHGFDPTPTISNWGQRQNLSKDFHFHEIGLAGRDGTVSFGVPIAIGGDDFTMLRGDDANAIRLPVARLDTLMDKLGHDHLDLLKMDIEGAEFEALVDIAQSKRRPAQLLIEFHFLGVPNGLARTLDSVRTLQNVGYRIFDVAPLGREISFIHESALKRT